MGIIYDLWETKKPDQKRILGVGYSSTYLTNEDKNTISYKMWKEIIYRCYGVGVSYDRDRKGKRYECCNSWLDYQNFLRWFNKNHIEIQDIAMNLTLNVISKDNTMYNPNNCAVVPKEIYVYLQGENINEAKSRALAEKYRKCITEDIYELLTEDYCFD